MKDDAERRRWSLHPYGIDTWDPALYDMVVQIGTMSVEDVAETVLHAARRPCFQTTPEGQRALDDLALAAHVQAALVTEFPRAVVTAHGGQVHASIRAPLSDEAKVTARVMKLTEPIEGVGGVRVDVVPLAVRD